ncbi:hypothetical protein Tco_0817759, partial [Tanacetum coccineum]
KGKQEQDETPPLTKTLPLQGTRPLQNDTYFLLEFIRYVREGQMSKMQPCDKEKMAQDAAERAKEVAYNNDEKAKHALESGGKRFSLREGWTRG